MYLTILKKIKSINSTFYIFKQYVLQEGCSCKDTEFGCCRDRKTPSPAPFGEGCGCAASHFGCCQDGKTI